MFMNWPIPNFRGEKFSQIIKSINFSDIMFLVNHLEGKFLQMEIYLGKITDQS